MSFMDGYMLFTFLMYCTGELIYGEIMKSLLTSSTMIFIFGIIHYASIVYYGNSESDSRFEDQSIFNWSFYCYILSIMIHFWGQKNFPTYYLLLCMIGFVIFKTKSSKLHWFIITFDCNRTLLLLLFDLLRDGYPAFVNKSLFG